MPDGQHGSEAKCRSRKLSGLILGQRTGIPVVRFTLSWFLAGKSVSLLLLARERRLPSFLNVCLCSHRISELIGRNRRFERIEEAH